MKLLLLLLLSIKMPHDMQNGETIGCRVNQVTSVLYGSHTTFSYWEAEAYMVEKGKMEPTRRASLGQYDVRDSKARHKAWKACDQFISDVEKETAKLRGKK